jgi:hypothetical protein
LTKRALFFTFRRRNPIFPQKSSVFPQKSPLIRQKSPVSPEKSPVFHLSIEFDKRALYFIKRVPC